MPRFIYPPITVIDGQSYLDSDDVFERMRRIGLADEWAEHMKNRTVLVSEYFQYFVPYEVVQQFLRSQTYVN